jgi:hypothetical protein
VHSHSVVGGGAIEVKTNATAVAATDAIAVDKKNAVTGLIENRGRGSGDVDMDVGSSTNCDPLDTLVNPRVRSRRTKST